MTRRATWITTASGHSFDLLQPDPFRITPEDIAHHLSHLCRYTGACSKFYSVAQHSVFVADLLPPRLKFAGLMHDGAEAYTGDVSSPMKEALRELAPGFLEHVHYAIEQAVELRFGIELTPEDRHIIKHADLVALATERRDLMPQSAEQPGWAESSGVATLPEPAARRIVPWSIEKSHITFTSRVKLYTSTFTDEEEKTPAVLRSYSSK